MEAPGAPGGSARCARNSARCALTSSRCAPSSSRCAPISARCARGQSLLTWSLLALLYLSGTAASPDWLRLQDGPDRCAGRLELLHLGRWGTLCELTWPPAAAQVICAHLGCGHALGAPGGAFFGPGPDSAPVWGSLTWANLTWGDLTWGNFTWGSNDTWGNLTCDHSRDVGVVCAGEPQEGPQVRLVNGPNRCAGRVEVSHLGRWGTVCDDTWDLRDAQVLCRQVRCGHALWAAGAAQFGRGSGAIWLDETNCSGAEPHLGACPARTWGHTDCYHGEDAGAVCAASLFPEPPHLRLAGSSHRCAGRVELLHLGRWGGVCGHTWTAREAQVVCRYLGCGHALPAPPPAAPGGSPGQVWLEQVSCRGNESDLRQCQVGPWRESTCAQGGVASVVCSGSNLSNHSQVRLANGPNRCAGRVEVYHLGRWGTVCDDTWAFPAAQVLCRYLGCGQVIAAPPRAHFGPGEGPVWLDGLTCTGEEGALDECRHKGWGVHTCEHREDASAICAGSGLAALAHLHLAEGPHRCAGRLQVLHEGRWGGVCSLTWHLAEAQVTCRQLGCGPALHLAQVSAGKGELTWPGELRCGGTEGSLLECQVSPGGRGCAEGHAHVTCAMPGAASAPPGVTVAPSGASSAPPGEVQVRLINGPNRCAGRVEVYHLGRWGTVCDDTWDLADAQVLCAHLGCGHALSAPGGARFGEGAGPIWLDGLRCVGTEAHLGACPARPWGEHTCNHVEDAGAVCSGSGSPGPGHQVRLAGAPDRCAGRVEVLHDHLWGTVCDDTWDLRHAQVVCAHLGCGRALEAPGGARYGRGSGPIWLDDVICTGEERDFFQCSARTWGSHNCHHGEDAGVICTGDSRPGEVRLVEGPHLCAGRVELQHEGQWGTVCDDGWGMAEAQVLCRQLGCGAALAAPGHAHFGRGSGKIWLDDLTCAGSEAHLAQCPARTWGDNNCHHGEDAAVVCAGPNSTAMPPSPGGEEPFQVRLADGPHRCAGRVEVSHLGRWGSVCDDTWDLRAAQVLCAHLGCGHALRTPGHARWGQGAGPGQVWLAQVRCTGEERTLAQCSLGRWGEHTCHGWSAQVMCTGADPPQVRLRGGPGPCAGQVQVLHNRTWHQVCGLTWGLPEAQVLCRQLGCGPALSAPAGPHLAGQGAWPAGFTCEGSESQLAECRRTGGEGPHTCAAGGAAGVRCAAPRGPPPTCAYLVALLVLMMSLGGALLWLTLRARCVSGVSPAHLSAPRAPGAIYLPSRASPGEAEALQLMDDAP